ncbi:MAG TPA: right-handed parallel beta-helix repeat-containing protein, partial [Propionibacteriaceae bacterium]|nr:right-handed parallel beta-helix repeat-containing protein [Propionibacteriaceae bacterium]
MTISNSDGLWAALKSAHAGDTILLAPGVYTPIWLNGFHFDGTVTITSADPANQAVLNGVTLNDVSGLNLDHLNVAVNGSASTGVSVMNSASVTLSNLAVMGTTGIDEGVGVMVRASRDVVVTASDFTKIGSAIGHLDSHDVTISNNDIHDIKTDGIFGGGSTAVHVIANHISTFHPAPGDHPDAIQFWGSSTGAAGDDITISDNVITRGAGDMIQGIFLEASNHVTITGNAMAGTMYSGISLYGVQTGLVQDNFVQGFTDEDSRIIIRGQSSNITVDHNVTTDLMNYQDGGLPNPNYVASDNT